ncbi:MAG: fibronectin type III domain-containing protein [Candidatus Korobacteraceae bacterium]
MTFAVTQGPAGATISGGILSWTPTHAQSRVANSFTITASSSGGSATQTFSVTPNGNINGIVSTIYVSSQGKVPVPIDSSALPVAAYVPEGGGYTKIQGTGSASGTFTILGVPPGEVLIQQGGNFVLTNLSDIDFSTAVLGRVDAVTPVNAAIMELDITFATPPPASEGFYNWYVPNLGLKRSYVLDFQSGIPSTTFRTSDNYAAPLMDIAKGDVGYFYRTYSPPMGATVQSLIDSTGPLPLQMSDGGTTRVTASTTGVSLSKNLRANIQGTAFHSLLTQINPTATLFSSGPTETGVRVKAQPFTDEFGEIFSSVGYDASPTLVSVSDSALLSDNDRGDLPYGNPYTSFTEYFRVMFQARIGSGLGGILGSVGTVTRSIPGAGSVITPVISPVTSPMIDGVSIFTPPGQRSPIVSTSPTVSWQLPAIGTAQYYTVSFLEVPAPGDTTFDFFKIHTAQTSIVLPAGVLTPSTTYHVFIRACSSPNGSLGRPLVNPFPFSWADAISSFIRTAP